MEEQIENQNPNVPRYTDNEVEELIASMQQPEQQNKQMLNNMTPELLNTYIDKEDFRDTDLLLTPHIDNTPENPIDPNMQLQQIAKFYNKTIALGCLKRENFFHYMEGFKDLKVQRMMSCREEEFTWREDYLWNCLGKWLEFEMTRGDEGFERLAEVKQIYQNQQTVNSGNTQQASGGILSWAGKKLGIGR